MFTEDMPKIVAGYFRLFDAVEEHFSRHLTVRRQSSRGELSLEFATAAGVSLLYFALRWDLWTLMHMPLWVGVLPQWSDAAAEDFRQRHQGRSIMHEGYVISPVDPAVAADSAGAQALIGFLEKELANQNRSAGNDNG